MSKSKKVSKTRNRHRTGNHKFFLKWWGATAQTDNIERQDSEAEKFSYRKDELTIYENPIWTFENVIKR